MMKHLATLLFMILCYVGLYAQSQTPLEKVMRHIEIKADQWQLTGEDYKNAIVSDMYVDAKSGNTYIYLQQSIDGIPVKNAITPFMLTANGDIVNVNSRFIPEAKSMKVETTSNVNPAQAIMAAAEIFGVKNANVSSANRSTDADKVVFANLDFVHNDVNVRKEYVLLDDKLILTWDMSLDIKGTSDYWNANISVEDGSLVAKQNYTIYCNHDHTAYGSHVGCGAAHKNDKEQSSKLSVNQASMLGATYKAFAFPTESPIHGEITTFSDDLYPEASPFGWHDTDGVDGAEYTITRGNNVHVYLDLEDTNFSSEDEIDGGLDLVFDKNYDINEGHIYNGDAGQINLFTTVNQVHDLSYILGFTEEAGNFQVNNYGKGGVGGDAVIAQAKEGFTLHEQGLDLDANGNPQKINNARFRTPSDGLSGTMQIHLWENSGGAFSIDSPANISGFVNPIGTAEFGNPIPANTIPAIVGDIALAEDGTPGASTQNCESVTNVHDVAGRIALVDRGLCNFSLKALNVQEAGAIACIICNVPGADGAGSSGEAVIDMSGGVGADQVTIPSIFVQKSVCDRIKQEINSGITVSATLKTRDPVGPAYRDAAFDLGVIAHEYGHGISNRLIGGPSAVGCLNNAEQMGEGISDLFSLLFTVEEGDTRDDPRGIGNYVDFLPADGGGIRTYPYTTDLAINPRNYGELPGFFNAAGEVAIYSVGELWTIAAWEMYWNIVDKKGLDITWKDPTAGNYIAGRLFMEGMKLVGCNPSLLDMRDALLAADAVYYNSEHELEIWTAFAKRGMGWKATGQNGTSITDGEANYDVLPLVIKTLKISKTANTLVDAGDEVEITLTANNHIPETRNGIVITDQIPEGASYIDGSASTDVTLDGSQLIFDIGTMEYEDELVITYSIKVDESLESNTLFYDNVDDGGSIYDIQLIEGFSIWTTSALDANSEALSLYVRESDNEENDQTVQINDIQITGERPVLRFFHKYNTEPINDGGFLRVSKDGGSIFEGVDDKFIRNGYNTNLDYSTFAIPNLKGFSGSSDDLWVDSYVDLSDYKGETISLQFRFGSNATIAADGDNPGWFVDDIEIFDLESFASVACINSDQGDEEQCSNELEFIINSNGAVGIDDKRFEHLSIGVAPNPTQDYFTVRINSHKNENLILELSSAEGKFIGSQSILNNSTAVRTFDVSNLASGVYFLTVRSEFNVVTTEKIVVD